MRFRLKNMLRITRIFLKDCARPLARCHCANLETQFQKTLSLNPTTSWNLLTLPKNYSSETPNNGNNTTAETLKSEPPVELTLDLQSTDDYNTVLQTVNLELNTTQFAPAKACEAILVLSNMKNQKLVQKASYISDKRFIRLLKVLEGPMVTKLRPLVIVSSLKGLRTLGVSEEGFTVKNLENTLMWAARSCPIKDLVMMLTFCANRKKTESQQKLLTEICRVLERRWVEIKDG